MDHYQEPEYGHCMQIELTLFSQVSAMTEIHSKQTIGKLERFIQYSNNTEAK